MVQHTFHSTFGVFPPQDTIDTFVRGLAQGGRFDLQPNMPESYSWVGDLLHRSDLGSVVSGGYEVDASTLYEQNLSLARISEWYHPDWEPVCCKLCALNFCSLCWASSIAPNVMGTTFYNNPLCFDPGGFQFGECISDSIWGVVQLCTNVSEQFQLFNLSSKNQYHNYISITNFVNQSKAGGSVVGEHCMHLEHNSSSGLGSVEQVGEELLFKVKVQRKIEGMKGLHPVYTIMSLEQLKASSDKVLEVHLPINLHKSSLHTEQAFDVSVKRMVEWLMDSGASISMTGSKDSFIPGSMVKLNRDVPIKLANGDLIYGTHADRVQLASGIVLDKVLFVPKLA